MLAYAKTAVRRAVPYEKTGLVEYDEFYPQRVKAEIDRIDEQLGPMMGLSAEQLDYVINYDIKYRMGQEAEVEADD